MAETTAPPQVTHEAPAPPQQKQDDRDDPLRGRTGVAVIKEEYVLPREVGESSRAAASAAPDDDAAEGRDDRDGREDNKRQKTKKGWKARNAKTRVKPSGEAAFRLCKAWETTGECTRGENCKYQHSWAGYFEVKPQDIHCEPKSALIDAAPHVTYKEREAGGEDAIGATIDLATQCPVFADIGYCTYGWRCRYLGGHVRKAEAEGPDSVTRLGQWELLAQMPPRETASQEGKHNEVNWPKTEVIGQLKSNGYPWKFTTRYLNHIEPHKPFELAYPKGSIKSRKGGKGNHNKAPVVVSEEDAMNGEEAAMNGAPAASEEVAMNGDAKGEVPGETEAMDVPLRPEEKRRLNWDNGLYLAPLTTVGNLPFRRVCVGYGASITISEMALAQPLITGQSEEWALVRRHESEKMFGVQLAGGFSNRMVPAAEVLAQELGPSGVDFVDVNMGCPIDLLFNQGAGSALMDNPGRLGKILVGMNRALGEIPLTVKFRTGVAATKPNAHKLIPRFATEWGASAMTLHGRSRQQRYSKLANWEYVRECVDVLRDTVKDAGMAPIPIFGNGDCFSAQSYWEEKERSGVDGVMVARGALIKPWIFTEIAERREWDISATERLDGIRKFAEYGLSHWGSDSQGVNATRRFLLEALSFQHRYIPIGLLERMPPMLNERPPAYKGRNELETLLASPYVGDWVKISEMFLGPVAEGFNFLPKHKSNAFGSEEAQG